VILQIGTERNAILNSRRLFRRHQVRGKNDKLFFMKKVESGVVEIEWAERRSPSLTTRSLFGGGARRKAA